MIPAQPLPLFPALVTAGWELNGHGAHPAAERRWPGYPDQSREGRAGGQVACTCSSATPSET